MDSYRHHQHSGSERDFNEAAGVQPSAERHLHGDKLWGYALTALSQFFLLLFLPYIFAASSADHFFGVWAYQLADFFLSRLLGLTAFFIPTGCFLVGCYYLFEKKEIGDLVRKIFVTACWFFVLNVFLLSWSGLETSRMAGLFPRFFHALVDHLVFLGISARIEPAALTTTDPAVAASLSQLHTILVIVVEGLLFFLVTLAIARTYAFSFWQIFIFINQSIGNVIRTALRALLQFSNILKYVSLHKWFSTRWQASKKVISSTYQDYNDARATRKAETGASREGQDPLVTKANQNGGYEPFIRRERVSVSGEGDEASLSAWGASGVGIDGGSTGNSSMEGGDFLDLTGSSLFNAKNLDRKDLDRYADADMIAQNTTENNIEENNVEENNVEKNAEITGDPGAVRVLGDVLTDGSLVREAGASAWGGAQRSGGSTTAEEKLSGAENYFGVRIINSDEGLFAARMNCLADAKVLNWHETHTGWNAEARGKGGVVNARNSIDSIDPIDPIGLAISPVSYEANKNVAKKKARRKGVDELHGEAEMLEIGKLLERTFRDFGIEVEVVHVKSGPVITCYELKIEPGVRLSRIMNLSDNLALALAAPSVRIVAPIPGKAVIGIEIPNRERRMVTLSQIVESSAFHKSPAMLPISLGASILGAPVISDLTAMPHLLVAGATGSGKSVLINALISSLILSLSPNEIRFLMVDPKMVELNVYNGIPHLLVPVISDPKAAAVSLKWLIHEMEARYRLLEHHGVRSLHSYHQLLKGEKQGGTKRAGGDDTSDGTSRHTSDHPHGTIRRKRFVKGTLPYIVVLIDEFADLMMTARKDVEDSLSRLAAMSRAVGIHLILATQRPSVDVITGVIKANFPSRVAFQVSSKIDSRTIIDGSGAEKLLGKGDMLFQSTSSLATSRIQGAFLSDNEVSRLIETLKMGTNAYVRDNVEDMFDYGEKREKGGESGRDAEEEDVLFEQALDIARQDGKISASYLQRRLRIGYNRAARLIETMQERGYISSPNGVKPRDVLVSS